MSDKEFENPAPSQSAKNEPWRQLYRYWLSKHVDGRPPSREDIDPITEIPRLVANLMLIDATADGFIYRFIGSEIVARTGQDMTGVRAGFSRQFVASQSDWVAALNAVRTTQQARLIVSRFDKQATARLAVLLLPLHTKPGTVTKILGGTFYGGYFPPDIKVEGISEMEVPA